MKSRQKVFTIIMSVISVILVAVLVVILIMNARRPTVYISQSSVEYGQEGYLTVKMKNFKEPVAAFDITLEYNNEELQVIECNDESMWKYIPSDGYIVPRTVVECSLGENVWDAVARVLNANQIDYAYTGDPPFIHGVESISSVYGTCYVYRCNHLEAGEAASNKRGPFGNEYSGWTYTVNGVYPGLGMNGVVMKDGDNIVFKYYTGYSGFEMDVEGKF